MTWTKLSDDFDQTPNVWALSSPAFRLHVAGLLFSNRVLTDGHIAVDRVRSLVPFAPTAAVSELVAAGLWEAVEDGYRIHHHLEHQPTREQVERKRSAWRERQDKHRGHGVTLSVTHGVSHGAPVPVPVPARDSPVPVARARAREAEDGRGFARSRMQSIQEIFEGEER